MKKLALFATVIGVATGLCLYWARPNGLFDLLEGHRDGYIAAEHELFDGPDPTRSEVYKKYFYSSFSYRLEMNEDLDT